MTKALDIQGLHAWYGESHILHDMNFSVEQGEVVTLLGRNGAGRTTTLRAIMGLTGRRSGSVKIDGVESAGNSTSTTGPIARATRPLPVDDIIHALH